MSATDSAFGARVEQTGIVTRAQLRAEGWSPDEIRAEIDAYRWRSLNSAVISTHNGPLTPAQCRWAVLLSAEGDAALCGLTALEQWGVVGFETPIVHVVVRRGFRVLPIPGVAIAVHESRRFSADTVVAARVPALTPLERATVDAAVWTRDVSAACRIVVAPVQQRLTVAGRIADELDRAGQVRHRRVLTSLLADLDGGAQALSEVGFVRFCRRHRLPKPECQVRLDSAGRRRYLDATLRGPDGRIVRVEIDGGVHLSLRTRWLDTVKDNDVLLDGVVVLRFPSVAIYSDDPRAVAQLRRALGLVSR